jgi:hypothetical protein
MVVVPNFSPIRPSFDATCWPSIGCLGARRSSRKTSGTCDKPLRDGALRNQGQLGVPIKKPGHPKIGQLLASGMENGPNMCGLYIYIIYLLKWWFSTLQSVKKNQRVSWENDEPLDIRSSNHTRRPHWSDKKKHQTMRGFQVFSSRTVP